MGGCVFDYYERSKRGRWGDPRSATGYPRASGVWGVAESERPSVHLPRILGEEEMVVDPLMVEKKEGLREPKNLGLFDRLELGGV
jgi:hypothetical protein